MRIHSSCQKYAIALAGIKYHRYSWCFSMTSECQILIIRVTVVVFINEQREKKKLDYEEAKVPF